MKSYRDLEIYQKAFDLAIQIHNLSYQLPKIESYEPGSQMRCSAQNTRSNIVEGYGRRMYKADFIKFLIYSLSSCDETISHLEMILKLYHSLKLNEKLLIEYTLLGKKINTFLKYVQQSWISGSL